MTATTATTVETNNKGVAVAVWSTSNQPVRMTAVSLRNVRARGIEDELAAVVRIVAISEGLDAADIKLITTVVPVDQA